MPDNTPKCACGTAVFMSLEGSLDALLQGYVACKGCGRRIEVADEAPASELDRAVSNILGRPVHFRLQP